MSSMTTCRQMSPSDGHALRELFRASPDMGIVTLYTHFPINPYDALMMTRLRNIGMVAEHSQTGLIGAGVASFGHFQYEGQFRPYAFLHKLVVHPHHRRQGIATQLTQQLISCAHESIGNEGVIFGGIQTNNTASLALAKKLEFQLTGEFYGSFVSTTHQPSPTLSGITVRLGQPSDYETFVQRQNEFYEQYNLYPIETIESFQQWLTRTPLDAPFRHCYVATGENNKLVAGLTISEDYKISEVHFLHVPLLLSLLNKLLHIVPDDGIMRQIAVNRLWFEKGELESARYLWEQVRWEMHHKGNTLLLYYDPRSPLKNLLQLPFYTPKGKLTLMVHGPVPMDKATLICPPA